MRRVSWVTLCAMTLWSAPFGCRAAEPAAGQVLFDFETVDLARLTEQDAAAKVVDGLDGKALEIVTREGAGYPGVLFRPADGAWDLRGAYAVAVDVFNPEDQPVRVLLQADNPGTTGVEGCSCASATIEPRRRGTVITTFGEWHGQAKPLDESRIISLRVFLDRPTGSRRFQIDNLRSVLFDRSRAEALMQSEFQQSVVNVLGRGINMGNMLEAPQEGAWGVRLDEAYFGEIAAAGFQNVRIPVRWSAHASADPPYTIAPEFLQRVRRAVDHALACGLRVVLNMHHYEEIMADPAAHRDRFLALWSQIAEAFADEPEALWLELLNEPSGKLTAEPWNALVGAAIPVVRATNPERMLVIGPPAWNAIDALPRLELPEDDRRITVTFHYYNPFSFTHQGASWVGAQSQQWLGTKWLGTPAEQRAVIRQFDAALEWSVEHRRPLYMGEFGAYSRADMDSRVRWTRFVADQAIERKFGFSYWEFCSGFGAWDPEAKAWREGLKRALLGIE